MVRALVSLILLPMFLAACGGSDSSPTGGDLPDEPVLFFDQLPASLQDAVLWYADHEDGDLSDWEDEGTDSGTAGGGIFNTGAVSIWQDGQLLFTVDGIQTAISDQVSWGIGNYTDHIAGGPVPGTATIHFDDAMVATRRISQYQP